MDRPEPDPGGHGAPPVLHVAADGATLAQDLASRIAEQLRDALQRRPRATLLLSGGRTPIAMWQALSRERLPWSRVDVSLVDERWVPLHDPSSNGGLLQQHLLQHEAAAACWLPLSLPGIASGLTPEDGAETLETQLRTLIWPADVVVLGMGGDGHTASWFPGQAPCWDHPTRRCVAVPAPQPPNVPVARVTLTPAALRGARCVLLHVQGRDKQALLLRVLSATAAAHPNEKGLPIEQALSQAAGACEVYYAD